jgi:hypothetical protein
MNLELDYIYLSTLIDVLTDIKEKNGDKLIGFEDDDSYTTKCRLKTVSDNDLVFDISR